MFGFCELTFVEDENHPSQNTKVVITLFRKANQFIRPTISLNLFLFVARKTVLRPFFESVEGGALKETNKRILP